MRSYVQHSAVEGTDLQLPQTAHKSSVQQVIHDGRLSCKPRGDMTGTHPPMRLGCHARALADPVQSVHQAATYPSGFAVYEGTAASIVLPKPCS